MSEMYMDPIGLGIEQPKKVETKTVLGQVTNVQAFQDSSGGLHKTKFDAVMADIGKHVTSLYAPDDGDSAYAASQAVLTVAVLVADQRLCEAMLEAAKLKAMNL